MLDSTEIARLGEACTDIAEATADSNGYVTTKALLDAFEAEIIFRPLLVEAMLASRGSKWVLLLDSEKSGITVQHIENESGAQRLPARVRNTIAHELVHGLCFSRTAVGPRWRSALGTEINDARSVKSAEKAVERLSPLVLIPKSKLTQTLQLIHGPLGIDDLLALRAQFGVSRELLVNRLRLLFGESKTTSPYGIDAITDIGVGIGEWSLAGRRRLCPWPLFLNFERNVVPAGFRQLIEVGPQDMTDFAPTLELEAETLTGTTSTDAGITSSVMSERMRISIQVERTPCIAGRKFMFVVNRPEEDWPVERRELVERVRRARADRHKSASTRSDSVVVVRSNDGRAASSPSVDSSTLDAAGRAVMARAIAAFGDRRLSEDWLRRPCRALGNQIPLDLLSSNAEIAMVADELGRIEHSELY